MRYLPSGCVDVSSSQKPPSVERSRCNTPLPSCEMEKLRKSSTRRFTGPVLDRGGNCSMPIFYHKLPTFFVRIETFCIPPFPNTPGVPEELPPSSYFCVIRLSFLSVPSCSRSLYWAPTLRYPVSRASRVFICSHEPDRPTLLDVTSSFVALLLIETTNPVITPPIRENPIKPTEI